MLPPERQQLFRQLAIFRGGWTLAAAEAMCATDLDVFEGLGALVDHSLIVQSEQPDGSSRFSMLETVREFGQEQLAARGDADAVAERHGRWVLALAQQAGTEHSGAQPWRRFDQLEADHDNVRAALDHALRRGNGEAALRIAVAVGDFWHARLHLVEGLRWMERAVDAAPDAPAAMRAAAYIWMGEYARQQVSFAQGERALERAIALYSTANDPAGLAAARSALAWTVMLQGRMQQGCELHEQAVAAARVSGDRLRLADALASHAGVLEDVCEYDRALALAEESLTIFRQASERRGVSRALGYIGYVALYQGDLDRATRFAEECLALARGVHELYASLAEGLLANIAVERGEWDKAELFFPRPY